MSTDAAARLERDLELLDQVGAVFRRMVDLEITEGVEALEALQSEGVRAVFHDQDLEVKAQVEIQRGKVYVTLVTLHRKENGVQIEGSSLEGFGGAVSTVQSILLRLALIFRKGLLPVLCLDESLPAFDDKYVHSMGQFLKTLCARMGVDILLVTHNPALVEAADTAYRIHRERGGASFHKIHRAP